MHFLPFTEPNPTNSLTEVKVSQQIDTKKCNQVSKSSSSNNNNNDNDDDNNNNNNNKCKSILYRPLGLQEVVALRISRHLAHEGGKVVSSMHRPPLPPGDTLGAYFC